MFVEKKEKKKLFFNKEIKIFVMLKECINELVVAVNMDR